MGDGEERTRIAVLGLGNVLMGDDAAGPSVIASLLASHDFHPGVSVLDAGTPGLDLTPFVLDLEALVVVDTVNAAAPPGALRRYRKEQLISAGTQPRLSPHDPGLAETLALLDLSGRGPRDVLLVGIVPERVSTGIGLTPAVREALPQAARAVLDELDRLGHPAMPRATPGEPDLWWERPVAGD